MSTTPFTLTLTFENMQDAECILRLYALVVSEDQDAMQDWERFAEGAGYLGAAGASFFDGKLEELEALETYDKAAYDRFERFARAFDYLAGAMQMKEEDYQRFLKNEAVSNSKAIVDFVLRTQLGPG